MKRPVLDPAWREDLLPRELVHGEVEDLYVVPYREKSGRGRAIDRAHGTNDTWPSRIVHHN